MNEETESVILCEGFHDRAFWKGCVTLLDCVDEKTDPFGKEVGKGHFGFRTPSRRFFRVIACHGVRKLLEAIDAQLKGRSTNSLAWLVANVDTDALDDNPGDQRRARIQSVLDRVARVGPTEELGRGQYRLVEDGTKLGIVLWETPDAPHDELPKKQTLERLVCAAAREVYPARAVAVESWLRSRPKEEEATGSFGKKAFAWSHMAGWYSEQGCDEFYQALWRDPKLAAALERRLRATGAWDIIAALAS